MANVLRLALSGAVGLVRAAIAFAVIASGAYVLGWRILYDGPAGSDIQFHLNLAGWISGTFPAAGWWYAFDDHGIPYRIGYPLAAHWVVVLTSRLGGLDLSQGMQLVEFAITPLGALGIYAYCAWRLGSPLTGLVAGVLYLLSPLSWTTLVDGGIFANEAGTVLFMPCLLAIDTCCDAWQAGRRDRTFRLALMAAAGLVALMGFVSPFQLGAATAAVVAYALAIRPGPGAGRLRWLLVMAPALLLLALSLTAFWSLPQQAYLSLVASRVPPRSYDPNLFQLWAPAQLLALQPIDPNQGTGHNSLSPAVTLPALLGVLAAVRDRRTRALVALVAWGLLTMVSHALAAITWGLPLLPYLVHARGGLTLVQFLVPVLAGIGLVRLPALLGAAAGARLAWGRPGRTALASAGVAVGLVAGTAGVAVFAHWISDPSRLAYGAYLPQSSDIWMTAPPGQPVGQRPIGPQLAPAAWRPPYVGCALIRCRADDAAMRARAAAFPPEAQRAVVDAHVPQLLMDYHGLTGGSQSYSYNFQLPASPELDDWMLDTMLANPGTVAKEQVAQLTGIDAVGLGPTQAVRAGDYRAMGWARASGPMVTTYVNPRPTGLAAEWPAGAAVLVIGRDQNGTAHPYNDVFERATTGMIPYTEGWLARSQSAYVDDHPLAELRRYRAVLLLGYQYHDHDAAWALLDAYVQSGGSLYVETGWQYVSPDWDASAAPPLLPVTGPGWRPLDPRAVAEVDGAPQPGWGAFRYGAAGWGASAAAGTRSGAEAVVSVGGRVVAARWRAGAGRVFWSGANLMAHATGTRSAAEDAYLADQWRWLLGGGPAPAERAITWSGDASLDVDLAASAGPAWVLVKESMVPGWRAELVMPSGTRRLDVQAGEMDFVLVRVGSIPPGSRLVLTFGPTTSTYVAWVVSAVAAAGLLAWVIGPARLEVPAAAARARASAIARHVARAWGREDD